MKLRVVFALAEENAESDVHIIMYLSELVAASENRVYLQ